ncbi:DUF983 domain-containing protein [Algoriphagus hitonicola]|uniref:Uncharacterized conserved protein, DUF983 family n=1 Tax=Algoriphagus hitonicola TaxID=435880 RepID=A0A1I2R8Y0_9BACT|nr:DUF983 domain-containing protein [Algoriphagus hitonicola]SFG36932.1 Uncharacterized conserved protein, DUF983 family [Algoriphagus hitonicola]
MSKSLSQAIISAKCPRCREGKLFPVSVFSFRKLTDINHHCEICGVNLEPEPRFFDGAMYISYAFSVALVITVFVGLNILLERPELWMYLSTIAVVNIVLLPVMLRYSKVLYLYAMGKIQFKGD